MSADDTMPGPADSVRGAVAHAKTSFSDAASRVQDKVADLGHRAADTVGATATYVRDHGAKEMVSDIGSVVRTHPGKSLVAAVAVGFLVARALRHD